MGEERCIVTVWKIFMILSVTLTPAFPQQPESTGPKPTEQAEQTSSQAGDSDDVDQSFRSHADQIGAKRRRTLSV
jgi:hypothetical protein